LGLVLKIVTFKLDEILLERIDKAAKEEGRSRSDLIREAISAYLNNNMRRRYRKPFRIKYVVLT